MNPLLARRFNGSGGWQIVHGDAYSKYYPQDILRHLCMQADVECSPDTHRSFVSFIRKTQPNEQIEKQFLGRYRAPLESLQPGSFVSFEGSKILGLPLLYAAELRQRGIHTTVRWHEAIPEPEQVLSFEWGRKMVYSLSLVDTVKLHTDEYCRRLQVCFDRLEIRQRPNVFSYRLGIDFNKFRRQAEEFALEREGSSTFDVESASPRQKILVAEAMRTRRKIPHRWVVADTLDPIKGSLQVYFAIREFLRSQIAQFDYATVESRHRFFIVQSPRFLSDTTDSCNMNVAYQLRATAIRDELESEFPGIVFNCECFRGPQNALLTAVYAYSTALSGGINDGLNLVVPECLFVNYFLPTSVNHGIIGAGAGFAMQCLERGAGTDGFFPAPGNVPEFVDMMCQIVSMRESRPEELRSKLCKLVEQEVLTRGDSAFGFTA
jgi:hypothetical protein